MNWFSDLTTNTRKGIIAAGALLSILLVGSVVTNAQAVASGQEIIVKTEAVDPRELLTGHYVQLGYSFSTPSLNSNLSCLSKKHASVWVRLRVLPGVTEMVAANVACRRVDLPPASLDSIVLHGKYNGYSRVDYGIERFYAAQDDAERIEAVLRGLTSGAGATAEPAGSDVRAVLSVGRDGKARLKALLVGDKRIDLSWL